MVQLMGMLLLGKWRNKPPVTRGLLLRSPEVYSSGHWSFYEIPDESLIKTPFIAVIQIFDTVVLKHRRATTLAGTKKLFLIGPDTNALNMFPAIKL